MKNTKKEKLHPITKDIKELLENNPKVLALWNTLSPLARNEWICYVISFKKDETRMKHLDRLSESLLQGKKRPCCWPGCPHR